MPECVNDCLFFFRCAIWYSITILAFVVILAFLNNAFFLGLINVQTGSFETEFLQQICLDVSIGCITSNTLFEVHGIDEESDMVVGLFPT